MRTTYHIQPGDPRECSSPRSPRAHAAELGNAVPEEPMLFLKPTSSYVTEGKPIIVSISPLTNLPMSLWENQ